MLRVQRALALFDSVLVVGDWATIVSGGATVYDRPCDETEAPYRVGHHRRRRGPGCDSAAANAFGQNGGTETGTLSLPAGSLGVESTDTLPPKVTSGTLRVTMSSNDTSFFDKLTEVLSSKPTFGARAVSCVLVYASLVSYPDVEAGFTIQEPTLQLLFSRSACTWRPYSPKRP
jgi:hypothetical protein